MPDITLEHIEHAAADTLTNMKDALEAGVQN
jgi:hypothetical protein